MAMRWAALGPSGKDRAWWRVRPVVSAHQRQGCSCWRAAVHAVAVQGEKTYQRRPVQQQEGVVGALAGRRVIKRSCFARACSLYATNSLTAVPGSRLLLHVQLPYQPCLCMCLCAVSQCTWLGTFATNDSVVHQLGTFKRAVDVWSASRTSATWPGACWIPPFIRPL